MLRSMILSLGGFAVLAGAAATAEKPYKEQKELRTKAKEEGVELEVSVMPGDMPPAGSPIIVEVRVTNRLDEPIRYADWLKHRLVELTVEDRFRRPIPKTRFGERRTGENPFPHGNTTKLEPGQTYRATFNLARLFDLSVSDCYALKVRFPVILQGRRRVVLSAGPLRFLVDDPQRRPPRVPSGWPDPTKRKDVQKREAEDPKHGNSGGRRIF